MSPNEFQLRSALRDGEGEHLNPDAVIARARERQQARHDRRVRYGSVAAAVAIVAGIGVGGGVALSGSGDKKSSSANGGGSAPSAYRAPAAGDNGGDQTSRGSAAANPASSPSQQPAVPGPARDPAAIACPASPPHFLLPGGGGSGQFGAQGPLFSGPLQAVKVCAYASSTSAAGASTVLTGGTATDLTKSMEQADKALSTSIKCPGGVLPTQSRSLVIIGVNPDGQPMKPVVVTLGCPTRLTNGTALRYNWTPPASITNLLNQAAKTGPGAPVSLAPPHQVTGSPIHT